MISVSCGCLKAPGEGGISASLVAGFDVPGLRLCSAFIGVVMRAVLDLDILGGKGTELNKLDATRNASRANNLPHIQMVQTYFFL